MRIAQFTSSLIEPLGGAEQYCLALARHQHRNGDDVTVVTGWADDSVIDALAADGIRTLVIHSPRPYSPDSPGTSLAMKLRFHARELLDSVRRTPAARAVETGSYDVVHVHRFAGFGTGILRVRGARVVHTVHDYTLVETSASLVRNGALLEHPGLAQRLRSMLVTARLSPRTALIFPSSRTMETHAAWGFDPFRFDSRVIGHGWPRPRVGKHPASGATVTLLFLGKLSGHKGVPMLIEAWGHGIPGATLRIAGDGPLAGEVAAAAESVSGLEMLGWLDEAERTSELARADVLVFPSEWPENFPIVVAESILAGVPVVSTTTASPPLVDHEETGLLVEPTAAALRAALVRIVDDSALRSRLAEGAIQRAGELDMDAHGRRIALVYSPVGATASVGPSS